MRMHARVGVCFEYIIIWSNLSFENSNDRGSDNRGSTLDWKPLPLIQGLAGCHVESGGVRAQLTLA